MTLYLNYWTLISFSLLITTSPYWFSMPSWHYLLLPLAVLLASFKYRKARYCSGIALACVVILLHGNLLRYQTEMLFQAGQDITIIADVDSLFKPINYGFQGIVIVRSINGQALTSLACPKVRLKGPIKLKPRDVISASVKVSAIYGLMNSVGFDAEKYALEQSIVASLSINSKRSYYAITRESLRTRLLDKVSRHLASREFRGMILAVIFGVRDEISAQTWQQLKQSGLSHLISISGLHIAIVFTFGWSLGLVAMRVSAALRWTPVFLGLLLAWCYAWLAGFSIPTQRAWLMCCLVSVTHYRAGSLPSSYRWLLVFAFLVAMEPFSVLSRSLWMSMYAVAIIMLNRSLIREKLRWLEGLLRLQLLLVIAMAPLVVYLYQGLSIGSVIYNLLFVPWFSFVVMPLAFLALLGSLLADSTSWLWWAVDGSLFPVSWMIANAHWGWLDLSNTQLKWIMVTVVVAPVITLVRRRNRLLVIGVITLGVTDWSPAPTWKLTALDVGHGLAIVVQQGQSVLVYDTGAAWNNSSFAEQIVSPHIRYSGIENVDFLILSHFDNDHAGGWMEIQGSWQPENLISSQRLAAGQECIAGNKWQWQEIEIEALWPPKSVERAFNAHSCVVRLTHTIQGQSVLLTGDIVSVTEWLLLRQVDNLNADIIVVPHHGSITSSTLPFINAVSADIAIASVGKKGRWNLPSQQVVHRYENAGATWLDTANDGQITVEFYPNHTQTSALRWLKGGTWYRQMLRKGVE